MNTKKKYVGFKNSILKYGFLFRSNIRANTMLVIGYVGVIWIPCICSVCLRKLYSPWNMRQYKYNQNQYKGENQQFFTERS